MSSPFAYNAKLTECGTKHLAMFLAIREAIAEGTLAPGERLPSTRRLAELYGLSRGSVSLAYEMLTAEGFVQAGIGRGTFVAGYGHKRNDGAASSEEGESPAALPAITDWGRRLLELQAVEASSGDVGTSVPFAAPSPASSDPSILEANARVSFVTEGLSAARFPWQEWKSEVARQWKRIGVYGSRGLENSAGSLSLRKAIAGRLRRERGIPCGEEDIVITSGSMQAIALLAQLLLEEGKTAVVENPCYKGIERAIRATGAGLISQRTDRSGIVPQDWEATLLFVTPTRQFPTGVVLGYERRQELLLWASKRKAFIIEDDYDSDFRWGGRPLEPLKALDKEGRVVYVGTFSRSMGTSLRIGFAVVPRELLQPLLLAKKLYDPYPTSLAEQQALAGWMSGGGYDRHMRKTRRLLGKLERKLRECLETNLDGLFTPFPADAGMHVYARWEGTEADYERLIRECAVQGVRWKNGSAYELPSAGRPKTPPSAIFGFAHLTEREIEEGIRRIRRAAEALSLLRDAYREQGGKVHA